MHVFTYAGEPASTGIDILQLRVMHVGNYTYTYTCTYLRQTELPQHQAHESTVQCSPRSLSPCGGCPKNDKSWFLEIFVRPVGLLQQGKGRQISQKNKLELLASTSLWKSLDGEELKKLRSVSKIALIMLMCCLRGRRWSKAMAPSRSVRTLPHCDTFYANED